MQLLAGETGVDLQAVREQAQAEIREAAEAHQAQASEKAASKPAAGKGKPGAKKTRVDQADAHQGRHSDAWPHAQWVCSISW